jgi:hypothetical protein
MYTAQLKGSIGSLVGAFVFSRINVRVNLLGVVINCVPLRVGEGKQVWPLKGLHGKDQNRDCPLWSAACFHHAGRCE